MSQSDSDIIITLKKMEDETKALRHDLFKVCWFMRGGVTYSEAAAMSPTERQIVAQLVKENMETTKKTGQPFF